MLTLITYDTTGHILSNITGSYYVPVGAPYLEVETPSGKIPSMVDVSVMPNVLLYSELPPSMFETQQSQIDALSIALAGIMGGAE